MSQVPKQVFRKRNNEQQVPAAITSSVQKDLLQLQQQDQMGWGWAVKTTALKPKQCSTADSLQPFSLWD